MVRKRDAICAAAALSLALGAIACSDDEEITESELPECETAVTLSVTPGLNPVFTWTPECRLFSLGVELTATDEDQWVIVSETGGNTIEPGIEYGQVPAGATQAAQPVPLVQGESYTVVVIRVLGQDQILIGFDEFVP